MAVDAASWVTAGASVILAGITGWYGWSTSRLTGSAMKQAKYSLRQAEYARDAQLLALRPALGASLTLNRSGNSVLEVRVDLTVQGSVGAALARDALLEITLPEGSGETLTIACRRSNLQPGERLDLKLVVRPGEPAYPALHALVQGQASASLDVRAANAFRQDWHRWNWSFQAQGEAAIAGSVLLDPREFSHAACDAPGVEPTHVTD